MITKQVTIDYLVDETTGIGVLDGKYVRFTPVEVPEGAAPVPDAIADVAACAACDAYIDAGVRIPDEFAEVRECAQSRIDKIQAVL